MAIPIWKDKFVNLGNGDSAEYTIKVGNYVLYSGRAFKKPGEASIIIRINDICADYIETDFPDLAVQCAGLHSFERFDVCDAEGNIIDSAAFINDWSYQERGDDPILSDPVDRRVSSLQTLFFSRLGETDEVALLRYKSGNTSEYTLSADDQGLEAGVCLIPLDSFTNLESVTIRGITYKVVDDCTRFVLVYANSIGGWDTLLQGGNVTEVDRYGRHTALLGKNRRNYLNEVEKTFSFNTGWLTDEESSRMHNLLGSTNVYLYDIMTATYHPVIINNPECPYKRFRDNRSLVSYTIDLSFSENRIRK